MLIIFIANVLVVLVQDERTKQLITARQIGTKVQRGKGNKFPYLSFNKKSEAAKSVHRTIFK